jgi:hypothetical protein
MTSENEILASYLQAVANQRRFIQPWLDDLHFIKNGGKVFYAVDSDIVVLYTSPETQSIPSSGRKEGYAQIFPDDNNDLSIAIGRALGNHIFNRLNEKTLPILVIPPVDSEIRNVYAAIARGAEKEKERANTEVLEIRTKLSLLGEELNDEILLAKLKEIAPHVMRILSGSGKIAEFRHFNYLLANTKITPPEFLLKQNLIDDEKIRYALTPVKDINGWLRFSRLFSRWQKLVNETKSPQKSPEAVEIDAKVLAKVEWINHRMDPQMHRLVYITGDMSLHAAARMHEGYQENESHTFARLYLRHPRAFLAEHNILSMPKGTGSVTNGNPFVESLDTFLAKFQLGSTENNVKALDDLVHKKPADLAKMVKPVLDENPDFPQRFKESWKEYTNHLIMTYESPQAQEEEIHRDLKALKNDLGKLIARVDDKLTEKLQESWNEFFSAVTAGGYSLLFVKQHTLQPHCAPLLLFNSLKRTQKVVIRILTSHEPGKLGTQDYKDAINELMVEDSSGYSFYLAYALLFAQMNAWHIATIMTTRAIDIARSCELANITGREAYYLRAVALRHSAHSIGDLANVQSLITKAEECLEEDRRRRDAGLPGGEERFNAERLAINLSYNLFHILNAEALPDNVPNLEQMHEMIEHELNQLGTMKKDDQLKQNVERSLLTMMFMILFLQWEKKKSSSEQESMRCYIDQFRKNLKTDNSSKISFLVEVISRMVDWWTAGEKLERKKLRKEIQELLSDYSIQNHLLFPYDEKLYRFFRKIVESQQDSSQKL